jgi:hypothetical protein
LALALKSKLPSAGLVTVGAASQVASCAKTDCDSKIPIRIAAIAAVRHTARLNCPATARRPRFQVSNPYQPPQRGGRILYILWPIRRRFATKSCEVF